MLSECTTIFAESANVLVNIPDESEAGPDR